MAKAKGKAKKKKSQAPVIIFLILLATLAGAVYYFFGPNVHKDKFLYVRTGETYEELITNLRDSNLVSNVGSFDIIAKQWKLPEHLRPGKYLISRGISSFGLARKLKNGSQVPVKIVINKLRTKRDFIDLLSNNLEIDADKLADMLSQPSYMEEFGLDTNTVMCAVIPDTYEFYWNTSADKAFRKIQKNYNRFWTDERRKQAKGQGLTPTQATIIASIVDEETNLTSDKPNIASVYLNRLEKGMKLQADPTVKFAIGDFAIHRITGVMLQTKSPYNTYQNEGLPPGPICTPSASSVEAVLHAPKTNYIYFCAKADLSGASAFASTDAEHLKNAHLYQQALNARGIH
jgi:UPF0755 protein